MDEKQQLYRRSKRLWIEAAVVLVILIGYTVFSLVTSPNGALTVSTDSGMVLLDGPEDNDTWFRTEQVTSLTEVSTWTPGTLVSGTLSDTLWAGTFTDENGQTYWLYAYPEEGSFLVAETDEGRVVFNTGREATTQSLKITIENGMNQAD